MRRPVINIASCMCLAALFLVASCSNTNTRATTTEIITSQNPPTHTTLRVTTPDNPVQISVSYPAPPDTLVNPGGPVIKIALKNISDEPVISLTASTRLGAGAPFGPWVYTFDVTPANPLLPNTGISKTQILIGGGFSTEKSYPVDIQGTLQSGTTFSFVQYVEIVPEIIVSIGEQRF